MNILMIHPHDLFDSSEPWTIRIKNLAKELSKKNHSVKLCYFPLEASAPGVASSWEGVELIRLDRTLSPQAFVRNTKRLTVLARDADVVHFQKSHHYAAVPAVIAAYRTAKPLHYDWDDWEEKILFESCTLGPNTLIIGSVFKVLERLLPLLVDTMSVASRALRELAVRFGKKPEDIFDAFVGADLKKFRPGLDGSSVRQEWHISGPLVLYVGQLHGAQYADLFIRAANVVLHKLPDARFMIVGEGFLDKKLKKLACDLGVDDKVIFTGAVSHDAIPLYINAADICIASFKDTPAARCKSPLKIVEYLACGRPVVASNVGEIRNMVGGVGRLVEAGNFYALAQQVLLLLADKPLRERMGELSRQRAQTKYNWSVTADNLIRAYERAIFKK